MGKVANVQDGAGPLRRQTFERRTLVLATVPVVLIAVSVAIWLAMIAGRLPESVGSHWSGSGVADEFMGRAPMLWLAVLVPLGVGMILAVSFSLQSVPHGMQRIGAAFTVVLTAFMASTLLAGLLPQLDLSTATATAMNWKIVLAGTAISIVPAAVVALLVRASPPENIAAHLTKSTHADRSGALRGEIIRIRVHGSAATYAVMGGITLAASALLGLASPWWLIPSLPLTALVLGFLSATVQVAANGLSVIVFGGWRLLHIPVSGFSQVTTAKDILPLQYGGWGYRLGSWGSAFIVRRGPALVVELAHGRQFVVNSGTVEDAERMAALLNGYKLGQQAHHA
ncbi:DUF1648 domain-containing protein [Arthrobacter cryoconiti]|uniref:DUF1648 domain-containing protein n=1 Tax=Arthrobacter cryoconiti TaxID=748907 RepID=A0ABV8R398_9MICC|nr:DUF1648 domain-containing protein [Arthrobacter cryoconiti]MCC9068551.1 DUF1648 domain-containing protein [Arthrobacter cryoconiti]